MQTTQILPPSVQYVVSAVQWTNISTSTGSFPVENFAGNTNLLLFDRYVYTMHRYIGCIACRLFSGDPYGLPVSWQAVGLMKTLEQIKEVRKGKERKSIYMAPFRTKVHTKRSGMDHTILPANNTMPAFPSWRSPDVATTATEAADIQLQLTTHLSTPKGWKAELA